MSLQHSWRDCDIILARVNKCGFVKPLQILIYWGGWRYSCQGETRFICITRSSNDAVSSTVVSECEWRVTITVRAVRHGLCRDMHRVSERWRVICRRCRKLKVPVCNWKQTKQICSNVFWALHPRPHARHVRTVKVKVISLNESHTSCLLMQMLFGRRVAEWINDTNPEIECAFQLWAQTSRFAAKYCVEVIDVSVGAHPPSIFLSSQVTKEWD